MSDTQADLPLFKPDLWSDLLVRTLPGMSEQRVGLWRATLAAAGLRPAEWIELKPRERAKIAPLPEESETAMERRVSELRSLLASDGPGSSMWFLTPASAEWPAEQLRALGRRAPALLVGWGNAALLTEPLVAVVGSRSAPEKSLQEAEIISRSLVDLGHTVLSGGAQGIDQAAHRMALLSRGKTVHVLPEGLAVAPDFEARSELDEERVCLVSMLWPYQRFTTVAAMERNRLMAALAKAVVVVASQSRGGSLVTGREALRMDRPTLAVDHGEISVHTAGNHRLIQEGATPLPSASFAEGHAPAELSQALGAAAHPRPRTGDLFEGVDDA